MNRISKFWWEGGKNVLAPLVGGSDLAFRLLARKYGAEVTFTEMCVTEHFLKNKQRLSGDLPDEFIVNGKNKTHPLIFSPKDTPLVLQIASNKADEIIEMANLDFFKGKIAGIDLNCGCPQSFAFQKCLGAGLLEEKEKLISLCREASKGIPSDLPFTVKLRLVDDVPTTIKLIQSLYDVGVKAFTVHGRYAHQKGENRGKADWNALRTISTALPHIPIIGNGDILKYEDFERMRTESNTVSSMAGYGALLCPSIFQSTPVSVNQMIYDYLEICRGIPNQLVDIERHIAWMIKTQTGGLLKAELFQKTTFESLLEFLLEKNLLVTPLLPLPDGTVCRIKAPIPYGKISGKKLLKLQRKEEKRRKRLEEREQKRSMDSSKYIDGIDGVGGW